MNENMFLKLVLSVQGIDAAKTYEKLADYKARTKWDFLSKYVSHGGPEIYLGKGSPKCKLYFNIKTVHSACPERHNNY